MSVTDAPRLAILPDYLEERWSSMDLAAEMLTRELQLLPGWTDRVTQSRPPYRRRAARVPLVRRTSAAINADRLLNRMWEYPRHVARIADRFEAFHIVDHSYSQLVH